MLRIDVLKNVIEFQCLSFDFVTLCSNSLAFDAPTLSFFLFRLRDRQTSVVSLSDSDSTTITFITVCVIRASAICYLWRFISVDDIDQPS